MSIESAFDLVRPACQGWAVARGRLPTLREMLREDGSSLSVSHLRVDDVSSANPVPHLHSTRAPHLRAATSDDERRALELRLAHALINGDGSAAGVLWDHFSPLVRGLIVRALGPGEDVQDALQDVFMRVFEKGRSLRDPNMLRSYVVAVTVHYVRSQFRYRRVRRLFRDQNQKMAEDSGWASESPAERLALRALYRALDRLPASERLAFTLRFFEGMEIAEAAVMADLSVATFKRRLVAAKARLWQLTGEDPFLAPYLSPNTLQAVE
ncbi:MAG TPA: sigma-70 family RNA polymerase sigma factor [Polyangia bacterium]